MMYNKYMFSINKTQLNYILSLKKEYNRLLPDKKKLLKMIDQSEIAEIIYNSNAIENSTLTLKETEQILLGLKTSRHLDLREVYEAKNLSQIIESLHSPKKLPYLSLEIILQLHQVLLTNIRNDIAGRLRSKDEYVMIGGHIAPAPEHLDIMLEQLFSDYESNVDLHFIEKIAHFHLEFETIHPFNDGNGRIGRILINYQLNQFNLPNIIIRNQGKEHYYQPFSEYRNNNKNIKGMTKIIAFALSESLHKRLAYMNALKIITLVEYSDLKNLSKSNILNKALRQTIPAFREDNVWKIGI